MFILIGNLWKLECPPTVGIVAQTTIIRCFFKGIEDIEIVAVFLRKTTQEEDVFNIDLLKDEESGDRRFSLENPALGPSLQISDTKFSDDGEYLYRVVTDRGEHTKQLAISVTGEVYFL